MFQTVLNWISDLLWPLTCIGCKTAGIRLCRQCLQSFPKTPVSFSLETLRIHAGGTLEHPILSQAIWHLKYRNAQDLATPLGDWLATTIRTGAFGNHPLIVPIPLHPSRLRERGYNQAELIASRLSLASALALKADAIIRTRKTASQVASKSRHARLENMKGAFQVPHPEHVAGRDIILVDDVCTTGATLQAAATVLKQNDARSVSAIVLARG